jgi:hypothetical protein
MTAHSPWSFSMVLGFKQSQPLQHMKFPISNFNINGLLDERKAQPAFVLHTKLSNSLPGSVPQEYCTKMYQYNKPIITQYPQFDSKQRMIHALFSPGMDLTTRRLVDD